MGEILVEPPAQAARLELVSVRQVARDLVLKAADRVQGSLVSGTGWVQHVGLADGLAKGVLQVARGLGQVGRSSAKMAGGGLLKRLGLVDRFEDRVVDLGGVVVAALFLGLLWGGLFHGGLFCSGGVPENGHGAVFIADQEGSAGVADLGTQRRVWWDKPGEGREGNEGKNTVETG